MITLMGSGSKKPIAEGIAEHVRDVLEAVPAHDGAEEQVTEAARRLLDAHGSAVGALALVHAG